MTVIKSNAVFRLECNLTGRFFNPGCVDTFQLSAHQDQTEDYHSSGNGVGMHKQEHISKRKKKQKHEKPPKTSYAPRTHIGEILFGVLASQIFNHIARREQNQY